MANSSLRVKRALSEEKFILSIFTTVALLLLLFNAFPALSGDEYGSLVESQNLGTNLHAMSYFLSLRLWGSLSQQDWFLRTLSLLWLGAGLFWLDQWLAMERVSDGTRKLVIWLAVLNPFLWWYGLQIRFYATFLAASILFAWRFRAWQGHTTKWNLLLLILSAVLLAFSHLFGLLVVGIILFDTLWEKLPSRKKFWLVAILVFGLLLIFLQPVRTLFVDFVYRTSNPYSDVPGEATARGLSLGMLAKLPLTFYSFTLGERVYPLWWWLTLPAMLVMGAAFLLGIWRLRERPPLASLSIFTLLSIPFLYLVLDPLAPPSLQGAAPRYLIFVVPYFLYMVVLGAGIWRPLAPALILVSLAGLYCLAKPVWSNGSSDLVNWQGLLVEATPLPDQTCILTDGRGYAPVKRYAPAGTTVTREEKDCAGFSRIVLVSNDHRLAQVRYLDEVPNHLGEGYGLVSNTTVFPAQVTVYDRRVAGPMPIIASRLDIPEQDLHFPLPLPGTNHQINGFARLDADTPIVQIPVSSAGADIPWLLTNFRTEAPQARGTPVFRLQYQVSGETEEHEFLLRSGMETAAWDGDCDLCVVVYEWEKLLHLVGSASYPGAYRQYSAHIWGTQLTDVLPSGQVTSMTVTYLLPEGTGYFYGIFSDGEGFQYGR